MTLKKGHYDHLDLRPAIGRKGLKTFHLEADTPGDELELGCGADSDPRDFPITERMALRRGLIPCPQCEQIKAKEIAAEALEDLKAVTRDQ